MDEDKYVKKEVPTNACDGCCFYQKEGDDDTPTCCRTSSTSYLGVCFDICPGGNWYIFVENINGE